MTFPDASSRRARDVSMALPVCLFPLDLWLKWRPPISSA